jgi:hypothetical protein
MFHKLKKLIAESTKTAKRVLGMKTRKTRKTRRTRKARKGGYVYF